jgi:Fusaric acid resistance protein-like
VMMKIQKQDVSARSPLSPQTGEVLLRGALLAISCAISYSLITHLLADTYSISRDDDLLGGMWAVAATIFVYRYSHAESMHAALSRMAATSASFVLCLLYLLVFPFNVWGMAVLIGIGAIAVTMMGRPDDTITTGITIAVVMVVAELSPQHAWRQPILRLVDTAVGVAVGIAAAWLGVNAARVTRLIARVPPKSDAGERA